MCAQFGKRRILFANGRQTVRSRLVRPLLCTSDMSPYPLLHALQKTEEATFPEHGTADEKLRFAIRYAIMAPSSHNTQPWHFHVENGTLFLWADPARALPVVDPSDRELTISCGAALFCLCAALRHFGCEPVVDCTPAGNAWELLARVTLGPTRAPTAADDLLFNAIFERHTNRQAFAEKDIPSDLIQELKEIAKSDDVWIQPFVGEDRFPLAKLIAEADRQQLSDRRFRRELAAWTVPNRTERRDGMPGYVRGLSDFMSEIGPTILRTFDVGRGQAARDKELASGAPLLLERISKILPSPFRLLGTARCVAPPLNTDGYSRSSRLAIRPAKREPARSGFMRCALVVGTRHDAPLDWVRCGEALMHTLLRTAAAGVFASFLNQPVEVEALRNRVAAMCSSGGFPQLILRMGFGPQAPSTPRRDLSEVIL